MLAAQVRELSGAVATLEAAGVRDRAEAARVHGALEQAAAAAGEQQQAAAAAHDALRATVAELTASGRQVCTLARTLV